MTAVIRPPKTDLTKKQLEQLLQRKLAQLEFDECIKNLSLLGKPLHEYYLLKASKS